MIPYLSPCSTATGQLVCISNRRSYNVYFLQSTTSNKTYVGYSTDPFHRLRQHNGELEGGAKRTKVGRPWRIHCIVSGFPTSTAALQFEYRWLKIRATRQRITNGSTGERRYKKCEHIIDCKVALEFLFNCQWTAKSPSPFSFPLTLIWSFPNVGSCYQWISTPNRFQCWEIYQGYINYDLLMKELASINFRY